MKRNPQSDVIWETIRNPNCTNCELCQGAQTVCLLGDGPVPCEAMAIGEAPGYREDEIEIPFSGKSGILLRQTLKEIGLDPRKIYITNVVACRPPANRTPTRTEAKICSSLFLIPQIDKVKPKAILLLGNTAVQFVTGRKAAVTKMEGSTISYNGIPCAPCRHPSSVIRLEDIDPKAYEFALQTFRENLLLFKRILDPSPDNDIEFERFVPHQKNLDATIPYIYTDVETKGLNPFKTDAPIWSASWAQKPDSVYCTRLDTSSTRGGVRNILDHFKIIAHRAMFEGIWYRRNFGITPRIYHDTKLCAYLIDENGPSGLKYQAVRHLNVEPWDEGQDFQNPDFEKLLPYNARDSKYGLRLYRERDLPFLKRHPKLARLLRYILLPGSEVFTEVICNGYHINEKVARQRLKECEDKKLQLNKKINKYAGKEVNPGSPKQMAELFYEHLGLDCPVLTKNGGKSTAEAARIRLKLQEPYHPVIDLLDEWHKWEKYESTYITPWLAKGPVLHANYSTTGTTTGRLSSSMVKDKRGEKKSGAVIHQCPRDPFIRTLVSPRGYLPSPYFDSCPPEVKARPEDWCILAGDLSQVELRLVAHAAEEATMIEVFNKDPKTPDGDIHYQTARELQPKGEIIKETRKKAKAVNFGFVYGMWWRKFVAYALEKFDLRLTEKEGQDYRKKFFRKYRELLPWHRRVEAFVTRNGWIDSILGRRRHLPAAKVDSSSSYKDEIDDWIRKEAVRQAINSPIQGTASDIMLWILALIASYSLKWSFKIDRQKCFPIGSAHDSGLFECHKSYAKELKEGILWTVANLPFKKIFGVEMRCPILMDVNIYDNCWEGDEYDPYTP